jgi:hypothetical protein
VHVATAAVTSLTPESMLIFATLMPEHDMRSRPQGAGVAFGIAMGIIFGVIFKNIGLGIVFGVVFGGLAKAAAKRRG